MTAEIAIMNKLGIALAADSAVSLTDDSTEQVKKIYNTTNKLFRLSKFHPVGIMVYGNAELLETPWEVIIKVYRHKLGERKFACLKEYAADFISFVSGFYSTEQQERHVRSEIASFFHGVVLHEIDAKVEEITHEKGQIPDRQVQEIVAGVIQGHFEALSKRDKLAGLPNNFADVLTRKYRGCIDRTIKDIFQKLPLQRASIDQLRKIAGFLFSREIFPSTASGVVVAGFGENEIFPSLYAIDVDGVICNRLKYRVSQDGMTSTKNTSWIIPFAQQEMVVTFMEGIDPGYRELVDSYLQQVFEQYPHVLMESLAELKLDKGQEEKLTNVLLEASQKMLKKLQADLVEYRRKQYVNPIISTVGSLPKDELAAMAESLVNLTSFKRRISMEAETVGGPIDVAVISKGDGFVWIKRKHYFSPELNHHFFVNYYQNGKQA